jgi:hypothetical protein
MAVDSNAPPPWGDDAFGMTASPRNVDDDDAAHDAHVVIVETITPVDVQYDNHSASFYMTTIRHANAWPNVRPRHDDFDDAFDAAEARFMRTANQRRCAATRVALREQHDAIDAYIGPIDTMRDDVARGVVVVTMNEGEIDPPDQFVVVANDLGTLSFYDATAQTFVALGDPY